ncbi:MAG: flagellar export protein FliJ [Bdellovibrionales bacterium]|nr:flagellar export protein FliJ [Bdellovibrionales bacterium]
MKFKFRLDSLLHYRKRLLDEAQIKYRSAQAEVDSALLELQSYYDASDNARSLIYSRLQSGSGLAEVVQADQHIEHLKIKVNLKRSEIRELMMKAEEFHEEMTEAARQTKILEVLKEKKKEEHKKMMKKKEAKELDDLTSMRYGRVK